METIPERIDWLWFLSYNLDSGIPDHSVLSKARKRWGHVAFKTFFERIVVQCVNAGLVDGTKIFMDASLIDANVSNSSLIDIHTTNTVTQPDTVVADSQYGTIENLLACHDRGINAHMPAVKTRNKATGSRKDIYPEEQFIYDESTDTLTCPAGKILTKRAFHSHRDNIEYMAKKKNCKACELRTQCTRDNNGRSVQRHIRKEDLDAMLLITQSLKARRDIKTRQHLMERSYARSTRFGFDRARWRGAWKVAIQEYLVAAIQNIQVLIRYAKQPTKGVLTLPSLTTIKQISANQLSFS